MIYWFQKYGKNSKPGLHLKLYFPEKEFPFKPPFVLVQQPRFSFRTGHVTAGARAAVDPYVRRHDTHLHFTGMESGDYFKRGLLLYIKQLIIENHGKHATPVSWYRRW